MIPDRSVVLVQKDAAMEGLGLAAFAGNRTDLSEFSCWMRTVRSIAGTYVGHFVPFWDMT